jgi:hypothetical protein
LLILFFGFEQASAEKPGILNLFLSYFFCSAAKEGFQTQLFKTQVLTQPDFESPKKIHFKPEKGYFWFTLKELLSIRKQNCSNCNQILNKVCILFDKTIYL